MRLRGAAMGPTCVAVIACFVATVVGAQPRGGPPEPPRSARASAAIDLMGQWVSIVNEDWRWRMVTPPKGDYTSVQPLNAAGRAVADRWDPSQDGSCRAYGAAGLMRMPTRLRIDWDGDDVLTIRTDAGEQLRRFEFAPKSDGGAPTLQGHSVATWRHTLRPAGARGGPQPPGGSLEVVTTRLSPGWLRKNGVPYSADTKLTEYYDRFAAPNGDDWLVVTTIVEDPQYLSGRFITSSHFRREKDRSKWNPKPCRPL
jgi:hypothetical protein